jgi:hypothetical protein
VSNQKGHLGCSIKIGSALAKAISATVACHIDQAEKRMKGASENGAGQSEENCEDNPGNSAKGVLDKRLGTLADQGICDPAQLAGAATQEAVLFGSGSDSLDAQNGAFFCDSTSGSFIGDDDAGSVPATPEIFKCEATVAKAVAKLIGAGTKCHATMDKVFFFKGADFDEEKCEETEPVRLRGALDKFNKVRDKLIAQGICPPCLDGAAMDAIAANALTQLDAENEEIYPCNLAP